MGEVFRGRTPKGTFLPFRAGAMYTMYRDYIKRVSEDPEKEDP